MSVMDCVGELTFALYEPTTFHRWPNSGQYKTGKAEQGDSFTRVPAPEEENGVEVDGLPRGHKEVLLGAVFFFIGHCTRH